LVESGRLCVLGSDVDGVPEYAPIVGEMTTVGSRGTDPIGDVPVDPLSDVWLGDGLTGRHSHVFDLVGSGVCRAREIATAGGMGCDTARDALAKLVEVGLLNGQGTVYSVPADVFEVAEGLAVDLGGADRRKKLVERVRTERARPRGDAVPPPDEDVLAAIAEEHYEDELRRWHDDELMRQLGLV
jgi:hypothetical protein